MLPEFLQGVRLAERRKAELQHHMRNWMKVHAYIASLPNNDTHTMRVLQEMLVYELSNDQREHIVHRLYRKMAAVRRALEEASLYAMVQA